MKITFIAIIIGLMVSTISFGQNQPVKSDTLTLLLSNATANNKKLFLIFGWQGCGWCRVYDKYHSDSIVREILSKYFVISKVDIYKSKSGIDLYKTYGKTGTPSWTIFDSSGGVIIDSDNGSGNIGYPSQESEIAYYIRALKKADPTITDPECENLTAKLKDYRNMREQNLIKRP